ncbi:fumarate hydratase C-terminal domain-containing protein [Klebsiella variicola subsp. variicola]|nr:fumarate hydratase C-terminal domain-containing protein [Klebsiella variicola subsp. variicola]
MGVSCSADRNIKAKINRDGIWIEKLESNPGKYIPEHLRQQGEGNVVSINLNQPMSEIPAQLSAHPVSTRLSLQRHHYRGPRHRPRQAEGAYR